MAVAMHDTVFMDTEPAGKNGVFLQETPIAVAVVPDTTQLVSIPELKEALELVEGAIKESVAVVVEEAHAFVAEANATTTVGQSVVKAAGLPANDGEEEIV